MTDYLEELLEAWAEERGDEETPEFPQLRWGEARQSLPGERRRDTEAEKRRADEGGEAYERQAATPSGAEAAKKNIVSDRPGEALLEERRRAWDLSGGAYERGTTVVEALRGRLRRGTAAAAYRAGTPSFPETAERSTARERSLTELDAAFQRDARRYDGGFELF